MTTTIEDLVPKLLLKIFSHYIEAEGHMEFSKNVVPVCSSWWKLSTTPSLWKNIRLGNWNYVMSLSNRGLLNFTQSLPIGVDSIRPCNGIWPRKLLDNNCLLAVLSKIRDLKALEISFFYIDSNTMTVVAKHCPNLERLRMYFVSLGDNVPITFKELSPIFTMCGPKLKHLDLDCGVEDSEQIISEIAAKCMSLEVLEFDNYSEFPIYKLVRGCPRLRKLKLRNCEFVTTGGNDHSGFNDLTLFETYDCEFHGVDICDLLKNANNLEHLELRLIWNLTLSDISKIPSNKVKFLVIRPYHDMDRNFVALEQAVGKWKHTLLHLEFGGWEYNITSILATYLDGNQCPKLEVLKIDKENIDQNFLKTFVQKCQNLKELQVYGKPYRNREEIIKFLNLV